VRSRERFLQTTTGWLLRQLGVGLQKEVLRFVEQNLEHFSREGLKYTLEKTSPTARAKIQNRHKTVVTKSANV
jgi:3-methyladenine DNA glycosylase AlkD